MKKTDLTGKRFGRLIALCNDAENKTKNSKWVCQCDCGGVKSVSIPNLKSGHVSSCGCLNRELLSERRKTHGMSNSREYAAWSSMKKRCYNEKLHNYMAYGGRGITVCERWINSFENFFSDMGARPSAEHSIDRIDCDGNYCPDNCRWATLEEQANNMTTNRIISYNGMSKTMSEWAKEIGVSCNCLYLRLDKCGMTIERALTMKFYSRC